MAGAVQHYSIPEMRHQTGELFTYYNEFAPPEDSRRSPESNLMYAIVERAFYDLFHKKQQHRISARRFFMMSSSKPFTFKWICNHLNFNHCRIRTILKPYFQDKDKIPDCNFRDVSAVLKLKEENNFLLNSIKS